MTSGIPVQVPDVSSTTRRRLSLQPCLIATLPVDPVDFEEAVDFVIDNVKNRQPGDPPIRIVGPNAQMITLAATNQEFAQAMRSADLRAPDGISIILASRLLSRPIRQRIPGGELMERLCGASVPHKLSIFFLGGLPTAAETAARVLGERYPGLRVAGTYCPPYLFEQNPAEMASVKQKLTSAAPDLLFIAFGAPRQEIWMWKHCLDLPVGAVMSVGAAFDTTAGLRKRAPMWAQRSGTEWLYRLVMEPRRLWRRYLIGNVHFVYLVVRAWLCQN